MNRMLSDYRRCAARRDFLKAQIPLAERQLAEEKESMLENAVLPGRAPGTPGGGGPGNPTARLAVKFASGYQPQYIREMAGDLRRMQDELQECDTVCRCVDAWRTALNERERLVIDLHVIGGESYAEVLEAFARRFPATAITSRDGLRRMKQRAMAKIEAAAGV